MPITGVLDMQRGNLPLGEIRIGESEPIPGKQGRRPVRRDTFRFTTPDQETAVLAGRELGGKPKPWDRRKGYWVVDTDVADTGVFVPPRGRAVDSYMELWADRKCLRRCTGITEIRSGQPCLCPQPRDREDPGEIARAAAERKRLAADGKACKPITRFNVSIPWLPGWPGVWRLNTGSVNAAVWMADAGEVLERARGLDVYLPALLLIHWFPGERGHPYPVPVLRPRASAQQLAQLPAGMDGMLAQLRTSGESRLALTAGPGESPPSPAQAETPAPTVPSASKAPRRESRGRPPRRTAQDIADDAANATTRWDIEALVKEAGGAGFGQDHIIGDPGEPNISEELLPFLRQRWRDLPTEDAVGVSA